MLPGRLPGWVTTWLLAGSSGSSVAAVVVRMAWKFFSGLLEGAAERPRVARSRA